MQFTETKLKGAYVIDLEAFRDHRGSFARTFCSGEFEKYGLNTVMVQSNLSISNKQYTLRGMHYQVDGAEEAKLVKCIKGSILDTIIDIRRDSPSYCEHISVELTGSNNKMLYVPEGFAHGFITLEDNCDVFYQVSNYYHPDKERAIRWNDPLFNIQWPTDNPVLSEKDTQIPDFVK